MVQSVQSLTKTDPFYNFLFQKARNVKHKLHFSTFLIVKYLLGLPLSKKSKCFFQVYFKMLYLKNGKCF